MPQLSKISGLEQKCASQVGHIVNLISLILHERRRSESSQLQEWWSNATVMKLNLFDEKNLLKSVHTEHHFVYLTYDFCWDQETFNFFFLRQRDLHEYFLMQIFHASEKWIVDDFWACVDHVWLCWWMLLLRMKFCVDVLCRFFILLHEIYREVNTVLIICLHLQIQKSWMFSNTDIYLKSENQKESRIQKSEIRYSKTRKWKI